MSRENQTKALFWLTFAGAGLFYAFTAAEGYPWSASTHWALAWSGVLPELSDKPYPVWGYFVKIFGGHYIALSVVSGAAIGAFLAAVFSRHFGWRVGLAAGFFTVFMPSIWNMSVTGDRRVFMLAGGAAALWLLDTWATWIVRKWKSDLLLAHGGATAKRAWIARYAVWGILGLSLIFSVVSMTYHDYSIGEGATEYAEEILASCEGKWLLMSGVMDDQFYGAVRDGGRKVELVSLRRDDAYRKALLARVKAAFPGDDELLAAAEIGSQSFIAALCQKNPSLVVLSDIEKRMAELKESPRKRTSARHSMEELVVLNEKMVRAMDEGKVDVAGRFARHILANPRWQAFAPALAILGTLTGLEGDYVSSERFFRKALAANGDFPPALYNDFAETLRQLGKLDEAEGCARKGVESAGPKAWMPRLTLAQILAQKGGARDEIRKLAGEARPYAPLSVRVKFREMLETEK